MLYRLGGGGTDKACRGKIMKRRMENKGFVFNIILDGVFTILLDRCVGIIITTILILKLVSNLCESKIL